MAQYDFSGWATKNDLKCSDGRTIRKGAFMDDDGKMVPLVWNHNHNQPENVLGHALLENRDEGTYAYCLFNDTESGRNAKLLVEHGDITALSIYANKLKQRDGDVMHGTIREVSLVLAGANPGAYIDSVIRHGEEQDDEIICYLGEDDCLLHAYEEWSEDDAEPEVEAEEEEEIIEHKDDETDVEEGEKEMADKGKTVGDIINSMTEEQKNVLYALVGEAYDEANNSDKEGNESMKHNAFDNEYEGDVLSHSDIEAIFADAKRTGSLKEAFLAHADEDSIPYGITNIDYLYPEDRMIGNEPDFIKREDDWVSKVMAGVHHTPFSRVKSIHANITADEARAKGYTKGNLKTEEVFALLKRSTTPTTIYKKQKLDRDDIIDIKDFNVVAWLKKEMRMMINEEIARAILVGDNRLASSDDKINELNIRPIWTDADLYTVKDVVTYDGADTDATKAKKFIKRVRKSRKNYKGTGNPSLFTTEDLLTEMLLLEDTTGRPLYDTVDKLCTALRVKEIITVPVLEGLTRIPTSGTYASQTLALEAILVNLTDYNVGADKGGEVNMFDGFDIDYNQQKYLMETRCSGAMIKPYGAIAFENVVTSAG